jgi:hypothetical protein
MTIAFDQSASLAGTLENRPAPDPNQIGRFFQDTETGQLYRDYGTVWQAVLDPTNAGQALDLTADYEWTGAHQFGQGVQIHSNASAAAAAYLYLDKAENGNGPAFTGFRSAGNKANPTAVLLDTPLARFAGRGYDGEAWPWAATGGLEVVAAENHAPGHHGTRLIFVTTPTGTDTRERHVGIKDNGELTTDRPIVSTCESAPFTVASDEMVENLNANYLGGNAPEDFQMALTPQSGVEATAAGIYQALIDMGLFTE